MCFAWWWFVRRTKTCGIIDKHNKGLFRPTALNIAICTSLYNRKHKIRTSYIQFSLILFCHLKLLDVKFSPLRFCHVQVHYFQKQTLNGASLYSERDKHETELGGVGKNTRYFVHIVKWLFSRLVGRFQASLEMCALCNNSVLFIPFCLISLKEIIFLLESRCNFVLMIYTFVYLYFKNWG